MTSINGKCVTHKHSEHPKTEKKNTHENRSIRAEGVWVHIRVCRSCGRVSAIVVTVVAIAESRLEYKQFSCNFRPSSETVGQRMPQIDLAFARCSIWRDAKHLLLFALRKRKHFLTTCDKSA